MALGPWTKMPMYSEQQLAWDSDETGVEVYRMKKKGGAVSKPTSKSKSKPEWLKKHEEKYADIIVTKPPHKIFYSGAKGKEKKKEEDKAEFYKNYKVKETNPKPTKQEQKLGKGNARFSAFIDWPIGKAVEEEYNQETKGKGVAKGGINTEGKKKKKEEMHKGKAGEQEEEVQGLEDQEMDSSSVIRPKQGKTSKVEKSQWRERSPPEIQSSEYEEIEGEEVVEVYTDQNQNRAQLGGTQQNKVETYRPERYRPAKGGQRRAKGGQKSQGKGGLQCAAKQTRVLSQSMQTPSGFVEAVAYDTMEYAYGYPPMRDEEYDYENDFEEE